MITAAQVQNVNGMASLGNKVFRDQITSQGPSASKKTIRAAALKTANGPFIILLSYNSKHCQHHTELLLASWPGSRDQQKRRHQQFDIG